MIVRYTREMKKKIRILQRSQGMGQKIYVEYLPKCRRLDRGRNCQRGNALKQSVKVYPGFAYASFCESDLMERPIEEEREAGEIRMEIKPYEIKTILFKLN